MRFLSVLMVAGLFCTFPAHAGMVLASKDLTQGQNMASAQVFNGFGCHGGNVSPELVWSGAPKGTKSFAVMAYDPDAPTGSGWWHWVVFNIPASVTSISTGASGKDVLSEGIIQGRTDFGTIGYSGPCPPVGHGTHHYQFTVYALSVEKLAFGQSPLDATAPAAMVSFVVRANALDHASLEGIYSR